MYGDNSCPNQLQSPGSLGGATGVEGQRDGKLRDNVYSCMDTCTCMCSSAHSCGCVADGRDAMAGSLSIIINDT